MLTSGEVARRLLVILSPTGFHSERDEFERLLSAERERNVQLTSDLATSDRDRKHYSDEVSV